MSPSPSSQRWLAAMCAACVVLAVLCGAELDPPSPSPLPAADALPDLTEEPRALVMRDGTPVTSRADWEQRRLPEIQALLRHYVYGYAPLERLAEGTPPPTVVAEQADAFDGVATFRHLRVPLAPDPAVFKDLFLLIPNAGPGPFPAIMAFGAPGSLRTTLAEADANVLNDMRLLISRGYAFAGFRHNQSSNNQYREGIYPHYRTLAEGEPIDHPFGARRLRDWGEIAAWSWCARRMLDVVIAQPRIDSKRVAILGGSRSGAAAMLTGAMDPRFAAVLAWQISPFRWRSGEGASGPWKHWMSQAFTAEFTGRGARMPIDYPCLAAAIAPRPLLISTSPTASFADPELSERIHNGAVPAYRLLGAEVDELAGVRRLQGLIGRGPLRMHVRGGAHAWHAEDYRGYLDFLDAVWPR